MKQIRESKFSKIVAYYLIMMMVLQITAPMQMYALTSGPTQPEFNSFTPIGTSDMVDLASGDFNYNIPIMDVGGYPINLSYNSGVTMDQEASWVGLGWNMNVGQIERQMRGLPDDFRGEDEMIYENDLRDNVTIGANFLFHSSLFGKDKIKLPVGVNLGLGVQYNNYEGVSFKPTYGATFELNDNISVGANFSSSVTEGASVRPSVTLSTKFNDKNSMGTTNLNASFGVGLSSRKGVENMSVSASVSHTQKAGSTYNKTQKTEKDQTSDMGGSSGSISFNNMSFTPSKRVPLLNSSYTFDGAFGIEIYGKEAQARITGYGSIQKINPKLKTRKIKAFGYENTQFKNEEEGVLDFNREKEEEVSQNTTALPITNYTYDVYTIQGQGVSGMFRPYRSQVSHVYNDIVTDYGDSKSFGVEFGGGSLFHGGVNFNMTPSSSSTGRWNDGNNALPYFKESNFDNNKINYEPYAFKLVGEMNVDRDKDFINSLKSDKALRIKLDGYDFNWKTTNSFRDHSGTDHLSFSKMKRKMRIQRSKAIQKITAKLAQNDPSININELSKLHHTAGVKVLQPGGSTYVYGEAVYNIEKVEATFDVSKKALDSNNIHKDETINYDGDINGKVKDNGTKNSDHFVNKITTPAYAHSYLLTSVLSSDYEDVDANGVSDNDLGTYTKFVYDQKASKNNPYQWRVPYGENRATYNEGLKSSENDDKGNYLYGKKELKYLKYIETKTHVAYFDIEPRKDAMGVAGESGGEGNGRMYCLKSIRLYAKAELKAANITIADGPDLGDNTIKPIKTAHFNYTYSLCKGTPSTIGGETGKLTLESVYFTYKGSNMGKYTPYKFKYSESYTLPGSSQTEFFDYNMKGYDIWGNYKPKSATGALTNSEFPFVEQDKAKADAYTSAWTLNRIELPSGGVINIATESDDYQYVQNKKAMQMFKVVGVGNSDATMSTSPTLYENKDHIDYLFVQLSDKNLGLSDDGFINNYLSNLGDDVYFRFLTNMAGGKSDFVSGYFNIEKSTNQVPIAKVFNTSTGTFAAIKVSKTKMGGGTEASRKVNPFSKSGWSFGRKYLNRLVYSLGAEENNKGFTAIINDLIGSIKAITEIYKGPNKVLEDNGCAKTITPEKSWIRLMHPDGKKLGGGLRVKSIELSDNWDVMSTGAIDNFYNQKYGQQYNYYYEDGTSSGVATFEPNASSENPFVKPFYSKSKGYEETLGVRNYIEEPFGENFFPSPTVTYEKVTVSNLERVEKDQNDVVTKKIKKHATGKTTSHFYTSRDFPTIVKRTDLELHPNQKNYTKNILDVSSTNRFTASQGFCIETNDMNGKVKSEEVFGEDQKEPISKVMYNYNVDETGKLTNDFITIDSKGKIETNTLGVTYDMITDFNESKSISKTTGVSANVATFIIGTIPTVIPMVLPTVAKHENTLRTATITKVVHKTGVLVEKVAYDLGSRVSTKNLAWDAESGDIILTETINEFNDIYYSFNFPAYWMNEPMGLASTNIGMEGYIKRTNNCGYDPTPYYEVKANKASEMERDLNGLFQFGDELIIENQTNPTTDAKKVWVLGFNASKSRLLLIDKLGNYIDNCGGDEDEYKFTIVRSGYRNLQNANMASVTSMVNPIQKDTQGNFKPLDNSLFAFTGTGSNPRIVNASAVVYSDFWKSQDENENDVYPTLNNIPTGSTGEISHPYQLNFNPYLMNVKGEWRAERSYAYLTGRNASNGQINNPRNEGFFNKFSSFYQLQNGKWVANTSGWQYASSVTQYSPFGAELENKDALDRYSAAQYGYNYTLPMAVASNSKYNEMGFEGFEETNASMAKHFAFYKIGTDNYLFPTISTTQSHTGKRSVEVANNTSVKLVRKLKPKVNEAKIRSCTYDCKTLMNIEFIGNSYGPHEQLDDKDYNEFRISTNCSADLLIKQRLDFANELKIDFEVINNGSVAVVKIYGFDSGGIHNETGPLYIEVGGQVIKLIYKYPRSVTSSGGQIDSNNGLLICE